MIGKALIVATLGSVVVAQAATPALPAPTEPMSVGWFALAFFAIIAGLNQVFDFYKKHIKEQPSPAGTYLTKTEHEKAEASRTSDRKEILAKLDVLVVELKESKDYQAKARQRIHGRLNRHENALYFMAGEAKAAGNTHAARVIRERLESAEGGDDEV